MKYLFLTFMLVCSICFSQENDSISLKKNSIFFQYLGNSANVYNIGYETIVKEFEKTYLSLSFGASYLDLNSREKSHGDYSISFPVLLNFSTSKKHNSHFETGFGFGYKQFVYKNDMNQIKKEKRTIYSTWRIGYKYQRPQGGFLFKIAITPTFPVKYLKDYNINDSCNDDCHDWSELVYILHFAGVSFGYTF